MGLGKHINLIAVMAFMAAGFAFSACSKSDGGGGGTVAAVPTPVPASTCMQGAGASAYPYGSTTYPNSYYTGAGIQPYQYNGSGCPAGTIPTCYAAGGGMQCVPSTPIQSQGYYPAFYGYNNSYNNYNYMGFYGGGSGGFFRFRFNIGPSGYYPNYYAQGCNVNSWMNSCGYNAVCQQVSAGSPLGMCVRY